VARGHADVVVVAAGASQRFGTDKLEADVGGRPLLAWTIDRLASSELVDRIVVVTAADRVDRIRTAAWLSPKVVDVVRGGPRRQDSVADGIAAVSELDLVGAEASGERVVLVHDGARPLVSVALIDAVIEGVSAHGAVVPLLPIPETVKRIAADGRILETLDRTGLTVAQTPQGATLGRFRRAFASAAGRDAEFTDEAALLEACTIAVHAISGESSNVKVTVPADLELVRAGLGIAPELAEGRVGIGMDSHPFGPGAPLALGGIEVPGGYRLHGHSDGDVALHAVADALLGAAGMGDLGRLFPAGSETPAGIASRELLADVAGRLAGAGWRIASIDLTVVGARPRLGNHLDDMRDAIASIVGVSPDRVSVKASSGNLSGMEGAGRGISATAISAIDRSP
jgi:2-C-methyl-D-erythritol 4-phosphate cytidylyltransferase/2-C-methyl-D-erythritol 2,4-cyclodiphosphate synthase